MRVGLGYDIHRLVEGRPLRLGGITIKHELGLLGHSDADVVLHAVTDAVLGAGALPDIGELFPDHDPAYQGADSRVLARWAVDRVHKAGWRISNLDVVIHAEAPKLSEYKKQMAEAIGDVFRVESGQVGVKAKTNEGVGPVGRGEAIACTAVALLERIEPSLT